MGYSNRPTFGSASPPRLRLVSVESRDEERDAKEVVSKDPHPTRRADGRTPSPRAAESALASALSLPLEALELLAKTDDEADNTRNATRRS